MIKSQAKNIIVGVKARTYPEERNFSGLAVPGFQFKKVADLYKYPAYAYFKLKKKPHPRWLNIFNDFGSGNYQILHFFNAVNAGRKPWISTFEYYMPRGAQKVGVNKSEKKYIDYVLGRISDDSCRQIIALSQFAYDAQVKYLQDYGSFIETVQGKMRVMHPSQKIIVENISEKPNNKDLSFVLIGADFFRKGGLEVLNVFDKLLSAKNKVKLTIVSKMQFGDYASTSTEKDLEQALSIIDQHEQIVHHRFLENEKVLELFKAADIALLPSYEETYGYTVLEAQAAGCPVITTNGTAFPEINNEKLGWLIDVDLDNDLRSVPRSADAKQKFKDDVQSQLFNIISEIIANPEIVKVKGKAAIEKIKTENCPIKAASNLAEIYKASLSK